MKNIAVFLLLLSFAVFPQQVSNLAVYRMQIDSALSVIPFSILKSEKPEIEITVPKHALLLEPEIRQAIQFNLTTRRRLFFENKKEKIHFVLEKAELQYPSLFRDGFLGEYYFTRNIIWQGACYVFADSEQNKSSFLHVYADTLHLPLKDSIETTGYELTQKSLPSEPVFISLLEPLTVVAALGITVYLFFSSRSTN